MLGSANPISDPAARGPDSLAPSLTNDIYACFLTSCAWPPDRLAVRGATQVLT